MVRNILLFGIAVSLLATSAAASGINLVQNGSFATGDMSDWSATTCPSSDCDYAGWYVAASSPSATFPSAFAIITKCDGADCGNPTSSTPPGDTISQSFATSAGQSYTLSFEYDPAEHIGSQLDVMWDGSVVPNGSLQNEQNDVWAFYTFTVTGTGSDTLEFTGEADQAALILTDISVTANASPTLPEPMSMTLIGGGLLGLGVMLRLRRKV
jgi:hypothetical protein